MSATAIGWIVSIAFIAILVIGFFVGFWRGVKKSTANLIFAFIGAIIAFFVTPSITNAVLNIQVDSNGTQVTLSQYLIDSLTQDENIAVIIERNPNINTLIEGLPNAIANVLVFLLVTIAIQILIYIVYKIITSFTLKNKTGEKKHRVLGGIVGVAKVFILTVFAFMPLAGLIGMYDTMETSEASFLVQNEETVENTTEDNNTATTENGETVNQKSNSLLSQTVPNEVNEIMYGLESNMLIKICGIFGLDNATFDYYAKVQVENNTVYIRQELENLYPVANFAYQISNSNSVEFNFTDIDYENLEQFINNFTDGGLFKSIIVNLANDIIQNYQEYPFISQSQDFTKIQDIIAPIQETLKEYSENHVMLEQYFSHDLKELFSAFKTLGESGLLDKIVKTNNTNELVDLLLNDDNISITQNTLINLLELNMVRNSISQITDFALNEVTDQFEKIDVDVSEWSEEDWKNLGTCIVNIANDYFDLTDKVDIIEIINDPTLLATDDTIDLSVVTSSIGSIIDQALNIKLLYTTDGNSIIANFLADNNLSLPTEKVIDVNGQEIEINTYAELFEFITPALITVKENNFYELLSEPNTNLMLKNLATILSQQGNEDLLSEIILPLSQVEPTKTFIVDDLLKTIDNNLVTFSILSSYSDWDNDLSYITDLLIVLNETTNESGVSYLDLILNGNLESIINEVTKEQITNILKPILYAKSTANLRDDMFTSLIEVTNALTNIDNQLNLSTVTLKEGENQDQAQEICDIFANFIELNKVYTDGITIKDIDKTLLAEFLTSMQTNAYREILLGKNEIGLFKNMFINLMDTVKSSYQDLIDQSEELQNMLDESNYPNIDFTELFNLIEEIESQI